ncbi:hypothetical protein HPP92_026628 [Vanilla planifolia]|uniref:Uncharacterized protein n=1 Tax=Vanilla planifolia TaxID=51239 RepID=A0A835U918_VANPL|nr:hypothetical protein HPP92_026628 [Vanilla planifolia]
MGGQAAEFGRVTTTRLRTKDTGRADLTPVTLQDRLRRDGSGGFVGSCCA